ncbi:hypothetical protein GCM10009771_21540 [Nesterenkonia flava]
MFDSEAPSEESSDFRNAAQALRAFEEEGGNCEAEEEPSFSEFGEALKCHTGIIIYSWEAGASESLTELEAAIGLTANEERFHVAGTNWAFSVAGEDSALWIHERLGGQIISPGLTRGERGEITGTVVVTDVQEIEVEPADMDDRRAALDERDKELDERDRELVAWAEELEEHEAELDARNDTITTAEREIEENAIPGAGMYLVGTDIQPGTYYTNADRCYWARLSGFSGNLSDILANGNTRGTTYVTIAPTDTAFETRCRWERQ